MTNLLFLDANALTYAYQAGGYDLLNIYAQYAKSSGYQLALTDVVFNEVGAGPLKSILEQWFSQQALSPISTSENIALTKYGQDVVADIPTNYDPTNAGDRSIAEMMQKTQANGEIAAVWSDDKFFTNAQLLKPYGLSSDLNFTSANMLNAAAGAEAIDAATFSQYRSAYQTKVNPFIQGGGSYSARLDTFISDSQLAGLPPTTGETTVPLKLLSAAGTLLKVGGTALLIIDALTTASKAATQLDAGNDIGAAETVSEFGARLAGGIAGAELLGAAGAAVAGPAGTLVGGLIGGAVGSVLGDAAVKGLWNKLTSPQTSSVAPDPRLTDTSLHTYADQGLSDLQQQMYQAGYDTPQVNFVVEAVKAELTSMRTTNPSATASDALDSLASQASAQISDPSYAALGSLSVTTQGTATSVAGVDSGGALHITTDLNGDGIADVSDTIARNANGTETLTQQYFDVNGAVTQTASQTIDPSSATIDNSLLPTLALKNLGLNPVGQSTLTNDPTNTVSGVYVIQTGDTSVVDPNINLNGVFNNSPGSIVSGSYRPGNQQVSQAADNEYDVINTETGLPTFVQTNGGMTQVNAPAADYSIGGNAFLNIDPLVLDLDGNGIDLSNWVSNDVYFQTNVGPNGLSDGQLHHTSWVDATDGILVFRPDPTKPITDITQTFSEFFGGKSYANGFAALQSLVTTDPTTGQPYTTFSGPRRRSTRRRACRTGRRCWSGRMPTRTVWHKQRDGVAVVARHHVDRPRGLRQYG